MTAFEEGYAFIAKQTGVQSAVYEGSTYVGQVDEEIAKLLHDLNAFEGFKTKPDILKGDIAEFWHSDTFNINAVARGTESRTFVDRSHNFASADVSSNFEKLFGLKYYKDGASSAKPRVQSNRLKACLNAFMNTKQPVVRTRSIYSSKSAVLQMIQSYMIPFTMGR